ncbi:MAG: sugar ABC transporter ATP-binding protein, partial [Acidimicrobiia bacterium]
MRGITISFPGVLALDNVDFFLRRGEVHSLMGENGAGKSTLIKALTGVYAVDSGSIDLIGTSQVFRGTSDAEAAGISTVYQEINLCTNLSVGENVMLGHEPRKRGRIDWKAVHRLAAEHLEGLGISIDTRSLLSNHSIAIQQLVAISRAMVLDAKVLVLDEPTSSLDRGEVEQLFTVIRDLRARGAAIIFVSHFLDQVYEIADRITVLRNGKLVGEYLVKDLPRDQLVTKMIGRQLDDLEAISSTAERAIDRTDAPILKATGVGRRGVLEPADLDVFDGEIVGIAGLLGSGRTELVRLLYGADRADSGNIEMVGTPAKMTSPRHAIDRGIAFSSEDRREEGIVADLTVAENIVLGIQARKGLRRIRQEKQDSVVSEYIAALDVRPADPDMVAGNLSGGNQQKVLIARWLATEPQVLLLDEPTLGIDIESKSEIYELLRRLAERGFALVVVSSEFPELEILCTRALVLRESR